MTEEGDIEKAGIDLLQRLGWTTYKLSQGYRKQKGGTRQTEGIADVLAFHPVKRLHLWWECKTPSEMVRLEKLRLRKPPIPKSLVNDWRRAHAQYRFGQLCQQTHHPYCYGGTQELLARLNTLGFKIGY